MSEQLTKLIRSDASISVESRLKDMDTYRTHEVTIRFRGFDVSAHSNHTTFTPNELEVLTGIAVERMVATIRDRHATLDALLRGDA